MSVAYKCDICQCFFEDLPLLISIKKEVEENKRVILRIDTKGEDTLGSYVRSDICPDCQIILMQEIIDNYKENGF